MKKITKFTAFVVLFAAVAAYSAGFSILEQSTIGMGRSLAGMSAETNEPSSLYFNPSSTAWFTRPSVHVGVHYLTGDTEIRNKYGSTLQGKQSGDFQGRAFIPNMAFVYPFEERFTLGLATSATSGARTKYPWNWQGRTLSVDAGVSVTEIMPTLSYRILDNLSIAGGMMIQHGEMELDKIVNIGYGENRLHMEGDKWAYGYTLGLTWKPLDKTTVGISYRSQMDYDIPMKVRCRGPQSGIIINNVLADTADIHLELPQSVTFGVVQGLTDKWRIMADIAWTNWSVMKDLEVKFRNGYTDKTQMNWKDSWRFALGTDYKLTDKLTVSFGVAVDQHAAPDAYSRQTILPDCTRYWISTGLSYQFTENLRADCSLMHLTFRNSRIHQAENNNPNNYIDGEITGYSDLVSVGIRYDF